jgi:hypothetical protein
LNASVYCDANPSDTSKYCVGSDVIDSDYYIRGCIQENSRAARYQTLLTYFVVTLLQVGGLFFSHKLVQYKNEVAERIERIAVVAREPKTKLGPGLRYHFFLRWAQGTAISAVMPSEWIRITHPPL